MKRFTTILLLIVFLISVPMTASANGDNGLIDETLTPIEDHFMENKGYLRFRVSRPDWFSGTVMVRVRSATGTVKEIAINYSDAYVGGCWLESGPCEILDAYVLDAEDDFIVAISYPEEGIIFIQAQDTTTVTLTVSETTSAPTTPTATPTEENIPESTYDIGEPPLPPSEWFESDTTTGTEQIQEFTTPGPTESHTTSGYNKWIAVIGAGCIIFLLVTVFPKKRS